ncbi:MAG: hypothetical protein ACK559_38075, partial [bacterium]
MPPCVALPGRSPQTGRLPRLVQHHSSRRGRWRAARDRRRHKRPDWEDVRAIHRTVARALEGLRTPVNPRRRPASPA